MMFSKLPSLQRELRRVLAIARAFSAAANASGAPAPHPLRDDIEQIPVVFIDAFDMLVQRPLAVLRQRFREMQAAAERREGKSRPRCAQLGCG